MHTSRDIDLKLKQGFRTLFPKYAQKLEKATSQAEINQLHTLFIKEQQQELANVLGKELKDAQNQCSIALTISQYESLINAQGDDIKKQLQYLIDGLQKLKALEKRDDSCVVMAQMLLAGVLGIGQKSIDGAMEYIAKNSNPSKKDELLVTPELIDAYIALAGISSATVAYVIAIVSLVVVIILIPIIHYFIEKDAKALIFLINELDKPLSFYGDYNVHGNGTLYTSTIQNGLYVPNIGRYAVGGFFATEKASGALIGTQYGFTMTLGGTTKLSFGVECPLTSLYTDNNCYCAINEDANNVAELTSKKNQQYWVSKQNGIGISIRCHSVSGSVAYYIARAYQV
ncbi:hypothetical protein [Bacillus stratosphericus]|uniref:hypothetical protein n=1 Tax=Bacillus stratosphericus TaxID=293386 RepID=UPI001CFBE4B2|nr:hypothetical protein [Bacillus stratosphericus]